MKTKFFTTLREAEDFAKKKILWKKFNWLQSGAEDEYTLNKNFDDLNNIKILPRYLNKIKKVNLKSNFFGKITPTPLILAPMGHQTQFHKNGEIETVRGANKIDVINFFGTQGRMSLKDISKDKKKITGWTIFPFGNKRWILNQIKDAEKNNCIAISVCIDANTRSHRYLDRESRYDARKYGGRTNPVSPNPEYALNYDWGLIRFIKNNTSLPVIPKGILTVEDCRLALKYGADGIWISNHGGRMFNSGITPVEAIINVKKKINLKNKIIIIDGAVRKGSDVIKYMCLGANFVAVGRPAMHGLICNGSKGVSDIFDILKSELISGMTNGGFSNIKSFKKDRIIF
jgi:isopentenyl diphosphate isomerase/L-lactate dehydrogenase-like FMN-dependent dehydrogenase